MVIHIGYHKSASTFFQERIFPNLPVNYVFISERRILDRLESAHNFDPFLIRNWVDNEIRLKYGKKRQTETIISHEELSGHPHGYKIVDPFLTARNLKEAFPDAKILVLLRNQLDYLRSMYSYRVSVKGYEYRGFNRFLMEEGLQGLFDHLEYHRLMTYYMDLFGKERVLAMPMEWLVSSSKDLFHEMLGFMELPLKTFDTDQRVNRSSDIYLTLLVWRIVNSLFAVLLRGLRFLSRNENKSFFRTRYSFYDMKRRLSTMIDTAFSGTERIKIRTYPEYADLQDRFARSNALLEKTLAIDLRRFGYPVDKRRNQEFRL